jgi:hypothetical protein
MEHCLYQAYDPVAAFNMALLAQKVYKGILPECYLIEPC